MKKTILVVTLTSMLAFTSVVVMAQENEKATQANDALLQDQKLARIDSAADYRKFTAVAELQISDNRQTIVNLKARKADPSKPVDIAFNQKVLGLEKDNDVLKNRLAQSDQVKTSTWTLFKHDFNRDMTALDKALRDI